MRSNKEILQDLYSGILNDYSIQRYSLGWKDVKECIEKIFKTIAIDNSIQFENRLIENALESIDNKNSQLYKKLKRLLSNFGRELNINLKSLSDKK